MITHIHHINFIVENLEEAVARYQSNLGLGDFLFDSLAQRAVKTARIKLGDTWLVLVQPIDSASEPAKFLAENGEGFFLISLGTDDLDRQLEAYQLNDKSNSQSNSRLDDRTPSPPRRGLENWRVADLANADFFGAQFQITEELPREANS